MVLEAGLPGIVFPSLTDGGGVNIVVYPEQLSGGDGIEVNDPEGRLPKDRSSWEV